MKILFEITHPAHVHLFRNGIVALLRRGHQIYVASRNKDVTVDLLEHYGIPTTILSRHRKGPSKLLLEMIERDVKLLIISLRFKPDVFVSLSMCSSHVAYLLRKPSLIFDDTEVASLERHAWLPFATSVFTPEAYLLDLGPKHRRYPGFHELAYLHPKRFRPDPDVVTKAGLSLNKPYFILRFVFWGATHDVGHKGFSLEGKRRVIAELSRHGQVVITSETPLPQEFEQYRILAHPADIHHLLYYAKLCMSEGATMASECAMLGVPVIYVNTITAGTIKAQDEKYSLLHHIPDEKIALDKAKEIIAMPSTSDTYRNRRDQLLKECVDVTEWIIERIEEHNPDRLA